MRCITILLTVILYACGPSNNNVHEERPIEPIAQGPTNPNGEFSKSINYDSLLNGLWYSEGNPGVVPHWLEFNSKNQTHLRWLADEAKPHDPAGLYKIIQGDILQVYNEQHNDVQQFSIDSLSATHLSLVPLGPSAGNLIYRRTPHRVIFFHLSDQEFDSLATLPEYHGLYEVSSDFGFYAVNVLDSLSNTKIAAEITSERFLSVGGTEIDKFKYSGYGVILIRTDSIKIQPGVMTDLEYYQLIAEFYN